MKSDSMAKLYDTLTVEERFRLRLQAFARRDMTECERLDRACPDNQYRAYCARIDASDVLTLCALVDLLPKLAKLQMVGALGPVIKHLDGKGRDAAWMGYLDGFSAGWRAAGRDGEPPEVSDDELTAAADRAHSVSLDFESLLNQVVESVATSARTTRDGLATFAKDDLGLSLEILLDAWGSKSLAILAEHAETLDSVEPDAENLELYVRTLDVAWRRHGLMDAHAEPDGDIRAAIEAMGW